MSLDDELDALASRLTANRPKGERARITLYVEGRACET